MHFARPNTFRVFGEEVEAKTAPVWDWWHKVGPAPPLKVINEPLADLPYWYKEHVHNKPHSSKCTTIRSNVHTSFEPIARVFDAPDPNLDNWWPLPSQAASYSPMSAYPPDSVMRSDFQYDSAKVPPGQSRFGYSPKEAAMGIVPINNLPDVTKKPRFWRERISYEHQYNSRSNPNYPIRSKRHGAFVWDQTVDVSDSTRSSAKSLAKVGRGCSAEHAIASALAMADDKSGLNSRIAGESATPSAVEATSRSAVPSCLSRSAPSLSVADLRPTSPSKAYRTALTTDP